MEEYKLEELTYQIVSLLKKWHLWDSVEIYFNGKCYSSFLYDNPIFFRPSTRGFRDFEDVWVSFAECHWKDKYISCYIYPPETEPVMHITCEGTALSDILCGKRDSVSIFKLPYHKNKKRIAEFEEAFYGLFFQYGIRCRPLGLYYSLICFEEKKHS